MRHHVLLAAAFATACATTACGGVVCETCGAGGTGPGGTGPTTSNASTASGACTVTTGTLKGNVTLFAAAGQPNSMPAPKAIIELRRSATDSPLNAMADDQSHYSVDIEQGDWIVGGKSADGTCETMMPKTGVVAACGETVVDVVLESCLL